MEYLIIVAACFVTFCIGRWSVTGGKPMDLEDLPEGQRCKVAGIFGEAYVLALLDEGNDVYDYRLVCGICPYPVGRVVEVDKNGEASLEVV